MKTRIVIATSFITTVIVLIIAVAVFALASPTMAQTLPSNQMAVQAPSLASAHLALPGGGGEQYWTVVGATFTDLWSSYVDHGFDFGGCKYFISGNVEAAYAMAPVNLPYGSTVTSMRFYYNDNDATFSTLELREYYFTHSYNTLAALDSVTGQDFVETTILNLPLDFENQIYVLHWYSRLIGNKQGLCSVRIGYTTPSIFGSALPVIQK